MNLARFQSLLVCVVHVFPFIVLFGFMWNLPVLFPVRIDELKCYYVEHPRSSHVENISRVFCDGHYQSPVNLSRNKAKIRSSSPFKLNNYDTCPFAIHMENNGHTVMLKPRQPKMPTLEGGGLKGEYSLVQVHWHWGSDSSRGSEHIIDGRSYPLEMHLVHMATRYENFTDALQSTDHSALAVLAFVYEASSKDNESYECFICSLSQLVDCGKNKTETREDSNCSFPMTNLLNLREFAEISTEFNKAYPEFYRYEGSLTTDTCNEVVSWTVVTKPIPISENQLNIFRKLQNESGSPISDNFRPVQNLGDRILRRYSANNDSRWILSCKRADRRDIA
ncbi:unnamed protein product [Notodromas monacha]|uniref:Carbonic anhydrase n=1 Tax=Notodromas monacha TaxID=399045 RepID=A0A7R9G9W0_9CRUS|nr:unnamed protein product [Notodromas monacha]CAG0914707.1 unnamed protein product [Notodromas monacha]